MWEPFAIRIKSGPKVANRRPPGEGGLFVLSGLLRRKRHPGAALQGSTAGTIHRSWSADPVVRWCCAVEKSRFFVTMLGYVRDGQSTTPGDGVGFVDGTALQAWALLGCIPHGCSRGKRLPVRIHISETGTRTGSGSGRPRDITTISVRHLIASSASTHYDCMNENHDFS